MDRVVLTQQAFVQRRGQTRKDYLRITLPPAQLRLMGLKPAKPAQIEPESRRLTR
jgi:hypothetical protein